MDHIGMDVHKKESQLCILTEAGELIERRVRSEPERFAVVLGDRPRARILLRRNWGRSRGPCRRRGPGAPARWCRT